LILKESRYVRLANTVRRVLRNSRMRLFPRRKSIHVFNMAAFNISQNKTVLR